eukprot:1023243-Prorocentrum_minimum.AAC.2
MAYVQGTCAVCALRGNCLAGKCEVGECKHWCVCIGIYLAELAGASPPPEHLVDVEHGAVGEVGRARHRLQEPEALDRPAVENEVEHVAQQVVGDLDEPRGVHLPALLFTLPLPLPDRGVAQFKLGQLTACVLIHLESAKDRLLRREEEVFGEERVEDGPALSLQVVHTHRDDVLWHAVLFHVEVCSRVLSRVPEVDGTVNLVKALSPRLGVFLL